MESSPFSREDLDPNHARILVVGPMFAGKTSLVNSLCHCSSSAGVGGAALLQKPAPTVGCNVEVKLLAGRFVDRFIEFWDVGGNPDAAPARRMFFEDSAVSGVLLVYDVSNPRSLRELRTWVDELSSAGISLSLAETNNGVDGRKEHMPRSEVGETEHGMSEIVLQCRDLEGGPGGAGIRGRTPALVVGNKADLGGGVRCKGAALAEELGAAHVTVSNRNLDQEPFERFFDVVFRHHTGLQAPGEEGVAHAAWTLLDDDDPGSEQRVGYGGGRGAGARQAGSGYDDGDAWRSSARPPTATPFFSLSSSSATSTSTTAGFDESSDRNRAGHGVAGRRVVAGPGSTPPERANVLEASAASGGRGRAGSGGFLSSRDVGHRFEGGGGGRGDALGRVWPAQRGASAGGVRARREKQC